MRDFKRTRAELEPLISKRLRKILISAYRHVPYYRNIMLSVGYDPVHDYRGPADLQLFPILNKSILKEHGERSFVQEKADLFQYFKDATSGSTGQPLQIWRSPMARSLQIARWLRVLMLNGYQFTDRVLSFTSPDRLEAGKSILQRFGLLRRQPVNFSLPAEKLLEAVLAYQPDVIYGNRSQIDLVAMEILDRGCTCLPVKFILVGAEIIREHHRRLYEKAYQSRVVEFYGSVEVGIIAFETKQSQSMQLCEDQIYFEFLNAQNQPAQPGEACRIVMTDLSNTLMPFIRYDQGDWLELSPQVTDDGRGWRMIWNIKGRDDDYAILPDNSKIHFNTFHGIMEKFHRIHQFRIIQKQKDLFEIAIAAQPDYVESIREDMLNSFHQRSPPDITFKIQRHDRIDPDSSGKLCRLISEVKS